MTNDYRRGLTLGLALGTVLGALFLALVVLSAAPAHAGPWLCPPTRVDDITTTLQEHTRTRPARYAVFYDSAYSTCFQRVTDDAADGGAAHRSVPIYSQLQAWNADQTIALLAAGDGTAFSLYRTPAWTFIKQLPTPGSGAIRTPRWSNQDPNIIYYVTGNKFAKINVQTDVATILHTFTEYDHLDGDGLDTKAHEDVSRDDRTVVLVGFKNSAETDTLQDIFVYHIDTDKKGRIRQGFVRQCPGGVCNKSSWADAQISPKGDYMLINWGNDGCSTPNDTTCFTQAYDTAGVWVGQVSTGIGHYDVTIGADSTQWQILGMANAIAGAGSLAGQYIAKYKIPDGFTRLKTLGDSTAAVRLTQFDPGGNIGGIHISGRAMGVGYVVVSSDKPDQSPTRVPFSNEIIKLYLNSTVGVPKLERLADSRSWEWYGASSSPNNCPGLPYLSYFQQPHATLSPDGTRILWGSSWGANCFAESYVMDISNKARNNTLINQTVNTWRRLGPPKVKKADGTGLGAADTLAPYHDYSQSTFAPEYGGIYYWGGGGHYGRMGNDVWFFNTADTTWTQVTRADTIAQNVYPSDGQNGSWSVRRLLNITLDNNWTPGDAPGGGTWSPYADPTRHGASSVPSIWQPWGSIKGTQRPWTSHAYQQFSWDTRTRTYQIWNPQTLVAYDQVSFTPPESTAIGEGRYAFRSKNTFRFDPRTYQWTSPNDTMPDLYAGNGSSAYDPINRVTLALNYDCQHTAGYGGYCGNSVFIQDSTGTWKPKTGPPAQCDAGQDTFSLYANTVVYDRWNRKFLVYLGTASARNCGAPLTANQNVRMRWYDAATNTWSKPPQIPDPVNGYPNEGDALCAYSVKDHKILIHGFQANFGSWVPTWTYDVSNGQWAKRLPPTEPYINGSSYSDINTPLTFDPVNNVFFLIRWKNGEPNTYTGVGGRQTNGGVSEIWAYKNSSGDGRLFDPITPGGGGGPPPGCGSTPGL